MRRLIRAVAAVVLPIVMMAAIASAVSAADGDSTPIRSAPGELVVDYAPGANADSPGATSSIEAMEVSLAASAVVAGGDQVEINAVTVTFNPAYPSPANVQAVVSAAAADWSALLDISGPVEILVDWFPFGNEFILGSAGPTNFYSGGAVLPDDSFTPAALANVLLDTDLQPDAPEIQVTLNQDFGDRWYVGTEGAPTGNQVDLYSVVLHELGHGFGFVGGASSSNGNPPALFIPPLGYDTHVYHGQDRLLDQADPDSLLESDNLFFDLPGGERYKLYDPASWEQGSSYSHFDEATYTGDDPGALMTPSLASAETQRTLDAPVAGVMEQIGWSLAGPGPDPETASLGGTIVSTDDEPVADMIVDLFVAIDSGTRGEWLGDARSAADGSYSFDSLPAGCYILTYVAPSGATIQPGRSPYLNEHACLAEGESMSLADVTVRLASTNPSSIGGLVDDPDKIGFEGLVVDLFAANGDGSRSQFLDDEVTGADGTYAFADLEPGCYVLVFIAPEGYTMGGEGRWLETSACIANPGDSVDVNATVVPGPAS